MTKSATGWWVIATGVFVIAAVGGLAAQDTAWLAWVRRCVCAAQTNDEMIA